MSTMLPPHGKILDRCSRWACVDKSLADTYLAMLRYGVVQRVARGRYVVAEV